MIKYDMLIICGLPRAGTTFVNNLFAVGAFGEQYYAHHSQEFGGLGRHPLHLCESQIIAMMFRAGMRIDNTLHILQRFWLSKAKGFEKIIVYKHPQIILQYPFVETNGIRIRYIFCTRDYEPWRESFIGINGHMGIHKDAIDSHYEKYWPKSVWAEPEDMEERLHILHAQITTICEDNRKKGKIFYYGNDKRDVIDGVAGLVREFDVRFMRDATSDVWDRAEWLVDRYWRAPL